jgi:hypothetical protein
MGLMGMVKDQVEALMNYNEGFEGQNNKGNPLVIAIVLVVFLVLHLMLGKYLWNKALVPLVPAVKPASSVWQVLGVSVLLSIMIPN